MLSEKLEIIIVVVPSVCLLFVYSETGNSHAVTASIRCSKSAL
jgi:hypothetical protein